MLDLIPPELSLQLDVKAYADPQLAYRTAQRCCEVVAGHGSELVPPFQPEVLVSDCPLEPRGALDTRWHAEADEPD